MGEDSGSNDGGGSRKGGKSGKKKPFWKNNNKVIAGSKFQGACEELKAHVFDVDSPSPTDQFTKTKENIVNYIGRNTGYKFGGKIAQGIEDLIKPTIIDDPQPANYGKPNADAGEVFKWETKVKGNDTRRQALEAELGRAYFLVLGQCSEKMIDKVHAHQDWAATMSSQDAIALLLIIKSICFNDSTTKYVVHAIHDANVAYYKCKYKGKRRETLNSFYERFRNAADVLKLSNANLGLDDPIIKLAADELGFSVTTTDAGQRAAISENARQRMLAIGFLQSLGDDFGDMRAYYQNNHHAKIGDKQWPTTLLEAYERATKWVSAHPAPVVVEDSDGVSFGTEGTDAKSGKPGKDKSRVQCRYPNCRKFGHVERDCPIKKQDEERKQQEGSQNVQEGQESGEEGIQQLIDGWAEEEEAFGFLIDSSQQPISTMVTSGATKSPTSSPTSTGSTSAGPVAMADNGRSVVFNCGWTSLISKWWILLDNQSTVDVFCNRDLLEDIHQVSRYLTIHTQAGKIRTNWQGTLRHYGTVWFCEQGIANILSMARVKKKYRVTYDSHDVDGFVVHKANGNRHFKESPRGLFYLDAEKVESFSSDAVLVNTVAENKTKYSQDDYLRAVLARKILRRMFRPSVKRLIYIIENKRLRNCPINKDDVLAAEDIWGPDLGIVKGKTVRKTPSKVRVKLIPIPAVIMDRYKTVTIAVDVMKVNKVPFLVSISTALIFGTVQVVKNQKADTLVKAITNIRNLYQRRGFKLEIMLSDGQFESMRGEIAGLGITLNTVARGEHEPHIERRNRTIKERCRCVFTTLKFKKIPIMMVVHLVYAANFWLNVFPPSDGVSGDINPRELVTGLEIDYEKHCQLEYGEYAQVHEEHDNSMAERTTGAIALRPTGNAQGGYFFFSLTTGRVLNRNNWTVLPMPNEVIERVETMAKNNVGLEFLDSEGNEIVDDEESYTDEAEDDESLGSIAGVDEQEVDDIQGMPGLGVPGLQQQRIDPPSSDEESAAEGNSQSDNDTDGQGDDDSERDTNCARDRHDEETEDDGIARNESESESEPEGGVADDSLIADDSSEEPQSESRTDGGSIGRISVGPTKVVSKTTTINNNTDEASIDFTDRDAANDASIETNDRDAGTTTNHRSDGDKDHRSDNKLSTDHRSDDGDKDARSAAKKMNIEGSKKLKAAVKRLRDDKGELPTIRRGRTRLQYHRISDEAVNLIDEGIGLMERLKSQRKPGIQCPEDWEIPDIADLEEVTMTQLNLKQGIKAFGQRGIDAVSKEVQQIHDRKVMKPVYAGSLSREHKKAALAYLMFLKEKRCGKIKGRGCADGRKQRVYTSKEDASSPTAAIESAFLSCVIDAKEKREVATVDVPGAFMQADMDELVHVRFEGKLAELICKLDPKLYKKFVTYENGKPVLYVELLKALYGTLRAAFLFWKKLTGKLIEWGFEINPYDWCVANKMVDGKQLTIVWHVDDLKISCVHKHAVDSVIKSLNNKFGQETPVTEHRGKVHDYLGMTIDFSNPGKVEIKMLDYVEKLLAELPDDFQGECATPAAEHLFQANSEATKLDGEKSDVYHHLVAKTLFLCKRARPDLQTAVAFLSTRVKSPDVDDYKKLKKMMQYLRATKELFLTLEADNLSVIKWWVDASFAVHPDMRSHTGGCMSLGKGAVFGTSTRQKLNTRSSTEGELVGVDDVMPQVLWTRYFLEAQGYKVDDNILYQDNQSAILLEKNGRGSSSKRTRHIEIRYYFVKDRIDKGDLRVAYCPTKEMMADFFTKPLQGTQFRKLRDAILNISNEDGPGSMLPDPQIHRSVLEKDKGSYADVARKLAVQPGELGSTR